MFCENGLHLAEEKFKNFMAGFNYLHNPKNKKLKIGILYSCGIDSSVLLDIAVKYQATFNFEVTMLYISFNDFARSKEADNLAMMLATEYKIDMKHSVCNLANRFSGIKEEARNCMKDLGFSENFDLILTGHHADDQLETVLFRLFRGSGVDGLKGMEYITEFVREDEKRLFGKPFLEVRKTAIIDYARFSKIHFIEDETNYNVDVSDRNYIRNNIIPLIEYRFNVNSIILTIENIKQFVKEYNEKQTNLDIYSGEWCINDFINLTPGNRVFVVREYFRVMHGYNFSHKVIAEIRKKIEHDLSDLCIDLGNSFVLIRDKDKIKVDYVKSVMTEA